MAEVIAEGGFSADTARDRYRPEEQAERPVGRTFAFASIAMLGVATGAVVSEPYASGRPFEYSAWALALSVAAVAVGTAGCVLVLRRRALAQRRPAVRIAALAATSIVTVWLPLQLLSESLMNISQPVARQVSTIAVLTAVATLCTALVTGRSQRQRWQLGILVGAAIATVAVISIPVTFDLTPWMDSGIGIDRIGIIAVSAVLMLLGQRKGQWLPAFAGLSLGGHLLATLVAGEASTITGERYTDAAAGMIALLASAVLMVGVHVELELDDARTQERLVEAWQQVRIGIQREVRARSRHDEVLHDLRSGLLGIESVSPLLRGGPSDRGVSELMELEVSRLRALTDSRRTTQTFRLIEALAPIVDLRTRQGSAITLTGAEVAITGVRFDIIEIVQNLIDNCVRHAPGSPITITVLVQGDEAAIRIGDRGPGIADRAAERIFDNGFTTHPDGTGLGLSSARWLARSQGGELHFESRLGGGSMFVLTVPLTPRSRR